MVGEFGWSRVSVSLHNAAEGTSEGVCMYIHTVLLDQRFKLQNVLVWFHDSAGELRMKYLSKPLRFVQELITDWFAIRRATCFASGQRSRHLARWGFSGHSGSWFPARSLELAGMSWRIVVCYINYYPKTHRKFLCHEMKAWRIQGVIYLYIPLLLVLFPWQLAWIIFKTS